MKHKSYKMAEYDDTENPMYYGDEKYDDKNYSQWGCNMEKENMACANMMEEDCCMPKLKCTPTKECVHTYKCYYKLYKVCQYHLYKVCPRCGYEFDYHRHRGFCPKCM